jgi:hypothetical protein
MGQELSWCSGFCLGLNLTENQSAKLWGMGTKYGVWHSMLHILRTEGMSFRMGQAYGPYNQTLKTVFSLNNLNTSSRKFRLDCVRSSISLGYTLGLCLFFAALVECLGSVLDTICSSFFSQLSGCGRCLSFSRGWLLCMKSGGKGVGVCVDAGEPEEAKWDSKVQFRSQQGRVAYLGRRVLCAFIWHCAFGFPLGWVLGLGWERACSCYMDV